MWKLRKTGSSLERRSRVGLKTLTVLTWLILVGSLIQTAFAQTPAKIFVLINRVLVPVDGFIAPPIPTGLRSAFASPAGVTVTWNVSVDTDRYRLEHLNPFTGQWVQIYEGPNTSFTKHNLGDARHIFRISACGGRWCSDKSATISLLVGNPVDTDFDGVFDYADACLDSYTFEVVDAQGCSTRQRDTDSDGVNDAIDLCPNTANGVTVSAAGCIPTTIDTDGDGVTDDLDRCGATPAGSTINNDGCAANQLDTDGDTITDDVDAYPLQHATQCLP